MKALKVESIHFSDVASSLIYYQVPFDFVSWRVSRRLRVSFALFYDIFCGCSVLLLLFPSTIPKADILNNLIFVVNAVFKCRSVLGYRTELHCFGRYVFNYELLCVLAGFHLNFKSCESSQEETSIRISS